MSKRRRAVAEVTRKVLACVMSLALVIAFAPNLSGVISAATGSANQFEAQAATGVTTAEALQEALNAGGEVMLGDSITLTKTIVVPEGGDVTLDLNGRTITSTLETAFKLTKGELSVTGGGAINATGEAFRVDGVGNSSASQAVLNIESGVTVVSDTDCSVFIKGRATVNTGALAEI